MLLDSALTELALVDASLTELALPDGSLPELVDGSTIELVLLAGSVAEVALLDGSIVEVLGALLPPVEVASLVRAEPVLDRRPDVDADVPPEVGDVCVPPCVPPSTLVASGPPSCTCLLYTSRCV